MAKKKYAGFWPRFGATIIDGIFVAIVPYAIGWFSPKELKQKHVPSDVRNIAMKAFYLFNKL